MVVILVFAGLVLNGWSLAMDWRMLIALSLSFGAASLVVITRLESPIEKAVALSLAGAVFCNFLLNFNWYPKLLKYQAGNVLAEVSRSSPPQNYVFLEGYERSASFGFYRGELIGTEPLEDILSINNTFNVYTGEKGLMALRDRGVSFRILGSASDISVSNLKSPFLDPDKRPGILRKHFLVELTSSQHIPQAEEK